MKNTLLLLLAAFFTSTFLQAQTIVGSNDTTICLGLPANLNAELIGGSYGTSSYTFEQYAYTPEPFIGGTGVTFTHGLQYDDCVEGPFNIGFSFCFFNQYYTQFYIGSNGWIGFTGNLSWTSFSALPLPNSAPGTEKSAVS